MREERNRALSAQAQNLVRSKSKQGVQKLTRKLSGTPKYISRPQARQNQWSGAAARHGMV